MIKPFGKHRTSVRARRNHDVSSDTGMTSRSVVRYRTRQKKRLFTVVTIVVASVMVPIMIASAANGNMSMAPQAEPEAQVEQVENTPQATPTPTPQPTEQPALTQQLEAAPPVAEDTAVTAEGEATPEESAQPTPEETAPVYIMLTEGMTDASVPALQQRLMDLYYMGADETTDYFGPQTAQAIRYFQRKHGLAVDGAAGPETQALLFSDQAKEYTMALGADGADVEGLQTRLKELGYPVDVTGYFGSDTESAVKYFQRMSGLTDDGSVGHMTEELIYSDKAQPSLEFEEQQKAAEEAKKAEEAKAAEDAKKETEKNESSDKKQDSSSSDKKEESSKPAAKPEVKPEAPKEESSDSSSSSDSGSTSYEQDPGSVEAFIAVAQAQAGKPYVLGGKGPNSFDCSGLIYYALRESGNDIGYMTSGGWRNSDFPTITSMDDLQRGDIICMNGHVAIYLGGGRVFDASSSQNAMVERDFGSWFQKGFINAKRPL